MSSRMRSLLRAVGLGALAAAQLWCAESEPSQSEPPAPSEAGLPETSAPDTGAPIVDAAAPSTCTETFCRVDVPGGEIRALNGVWARSASDVWIVGSGGFAAHYDGASWTAVATGTKQALFSVWGTSDGAVWATSTGNVFLRLDQPSDGGVESIDAGFAGVVNAVSGLGTAYAVGNVDKPPFEDEPIELANIWRFSATTDSGAPRWRAVSPPCAAYGPLGCPTLSAVWAESEQVQWFAGERGKVYRTGLGDAGTIGDGGGGRLRLVETSSSSLRTLFGLWGFAPDDIWAVGALGVVRHWVGGPDWAIVEAPTKEDLRGVWGARPDAVWVVGERGTVIRWNGQTWSNVAIPVNETNRPRLYGVAGAGSDVWIVGESTLLRSNAGAQP
jgi:hypothetical protein